MNFFFQNSHFNTICTRYKYDLLFTNMNIFNDVNVGRNILINSRLRRILFMSSDKKNETKPRKTEKSMEKENSTDESDFRKNEIPDLNYLKPFEFELEANIGDINSSSSDDEEERTEYKVKPISNSEWCE